MRYHKPLINLTPLLDLLFIVIFAFQMNLRQEVQTHIQQQVQQQLSEAKVFSEYKDKIRELLKEIRDQETKISYLKEENDLLKGQLEAVTANLDQLREKYRRRISALQARIKSNRQRLAAEQKRRESLQTQIAQAKVQQQINQEIADATQRYWNQANHLDKTYVPKIATLKKVFDQPKESADDLLKRADALDEIIVIINEWSAKEGALPTSNVDPNLVRFFAYGRDTWHHKAQVYREYADWLRQAFHYEKKGEDIPDDLRVQKDRINQELKAIAEESEYYNRNWEGLRGELSEKYGREFKQETVPGKYRREE